MPRTSLELAVEVKDSGGTTYRWGANQPPSRRLTGYRFSTKLGDGFSDSGGNLARRIDIDYPDVELLNDFKAVGADGWIAYEGRIAAVPRELGDTHSIGVTLAGYMAHAKDRPFREIYVDRDLGAWVQPPLTRRSQLVTANFRVSDPSTAADPSNNEASVTTGWQGAWAAGYLPISEAWYDAGAGLTVAKVAYQWKRIGTAVNNADTAWTWYLMPFDETLTNGANSGNLRAAGPSALSSFTPATPMRYMTVSLQYGTAPAGADGPEYVIAWQKLAVYGNHTVPTYAGEPGEPEGVRASDVVKDITARFCPLLNTDGVVDTGYVIQHLTFKDLTDPYDAYLQLNKYHLFHLGVWDDRTLHFRPHDLSDYTWEIRTDQRGTTFTPQGPTTDTLWNGIIVSFDDVLTGTRRILTPDTNPDELRDTDLDNPWNKWGVRRWGRIDLSTPTLAAQALQIGRAALAENNRPKTPGTITVRGYIRDRAGHEQPVWKVRAGDTIAVTNFPNDAPRLIHETGYDDETKTVTISVDAPASVVEAILDRTASAREARNLG